MRIKKRIKTILWLFVIGFVLLNILAFVHAYKFTHYTNAGEEESSYEIEAFNKLDLLLTGVDRPRPMADKWPDTAFQKVFIQSNKKLEAWYIQVAKSRGSIILFHGYGGEKSSMLNKARVFNQLGYSTLLVDFRGAGGSEGNETTIGYKEAEEVRDCLNYIKAKGEKTIHLFGTSMGAVAIMRSISVYGIQPASIIIECPFGTMNQTVATRFKLMGIPGFPMSGLLMFWGGAQQGYWAFSHNPVEYASSITCPALLLYGEQDDKVSREEIDDIYTNLKGVKQLKTYPLAGHENYLSKYKEQWTADVKGFLK
jgi:pimeloyl-ACP methyl ester carboxylesterase